MNKNISKTKQEMIGVRAPELRKIAKEVFKDGGVKGLFEFGGDRYFEETTARGLALGLRRLKNTGRNILTISRV